MKVVEIVGIVRVVRVVGIVGIVKIPLNPPLQKGVRINASALRFCSKLDYSNYFKIPLNPPLRLAHILWLACIPPSLAVIQKGVRTIACALKFLQISSFRTASKKGSNFLITPVKVYLI